MFHQLAASVRVTLVLTVLTGLIYPGIVTGLARLIFPGAAEGSLVRLEGKLVGSSLIGQKFSSPAYFHGRPSAAGDGYDAAYSSGSNLGPTSRKLAERVNADAVQFRKENPGFQDPIPADALTASGSGLDPHISPASARTQIARVAAARRMPEEQVRMLVARHTEGRQFGFLGEPRVNVLNLNLELDQMDRSAAESSLLPISR